MIGFGLALWFSLLASPCGLDQANPCPAVRVEGCTPIIGTADDFPAWCSKSEGCDWNGSYCICSGNTAIPLFAGGED